MFSYIPNLERDETLYSFCATVHVFCGCPPGRETARGLIGWNSGMQTHHVPGNFKLLPLKELAETDSAIQTLKRNTVAGFYLPFISVENQLSTFHSWFTKGERKYFRNDGQVLRIRLIDHPLKWCDQCVKNDVARIGRAYWHVDHQFGPVLVCRIHQIRLQEVSGRYTRWLLPTDQVCIANNQPWRPVIFAELLLAHLAHSLLSVQQLDVNGVRYSILSRLKRIYPVISGSSTIPKSHDLISWFSSTPISHILDAAPPRLASLSRGEWIVAQLCNARQLDPIRWLLIWCGFEWSSISEGVTEFMNAAGVTRYVQ